MPREHPAFRDHLAILNQKFPERELLTRGDIVSFTGLSRHGVANNFPFEGKYITKTNLARRLARLGDKG